MRPVEIGLLVLLTLVPSCAPDRGQGSRWVVSEELLPGGARLVVNTPPPEGARPTLVAVEETRIGERSIGGPESFGMIRQLAPLPGGGVAVLDGMAEELRIFGGDGQHRATFGGPGGGPGELDGAQGVLRDPGGLLRVPEHGNARISFFDPDSGFVRSKPLFLYVRAGSGPWRAAMDSAGRTAVWSAGPYQGAFSMMVRVYDRDMEQVDSIPYQAYGGGPAQRRDREGVWPFEGPDGMRGAVAIPFYPREHFVIDPTGQIWTTAEGAELLRVSRWVPAGDTVLVVESQRRPARVSPADREVAIDELEARFASWPEMPRFDYGEIPGTKPPLYDLSLDGRGRLWVRLSHPDADSTVYDVFDRSGSHVETVLFPARVDEDVPPETRGDTIWAVVLDEMDVQYVVKALLRPAEQASE